MITYRELVLKKEAEKEKEMKKNILVTILMCSVVSVVMLSIQYINARLNNDFAAPQTNQVNESCVETVSCTSPGPEDESNIIDVHSIILFRLQQFMQ